MIFDLQWVATIIWIHIKKLSLELNLIWLLVAKTCAYPNDVLLSKWRWMKGDYYRLQHFVPCKSFDGRLFLHSQLTYRFKPINSCVCIERSLWNGGGKIWRCFSKVTLLNSNKKWKYVLSSKVRRYKVFLAYIR